MSKRLGKFELPNKLTKVEEGATPSYAKFIAEPFEAGYGHTVGNSLRRVLLSSIEGTAISSVKIDGVNHEFQSIDGVVEEPAWSFEFNRRKRSLGLCFHHRKAVELSLHLVEHNGPEEVLDTLLHEIAHALVGPRHGHDAVWKRNG